MDASPISSNTGPLNPNHPSTLPNIHQITQELSLKLNTDNFLLWKTQVLPVLRCHGLMGFIDGTSSRPTDDSAVQWDKLDQMVLGWLLVSLSDVALSQVVDKHTARQVWVTLELLYGLQSRSRIQILKNELQTLHKGSHSIQSYVQKAKSISLMLASSGKPVDDDDLVLCTLRGLSSEYDPIVAAINSRSLSPSFDEVCGLLFDFDIRLSSVSNTEKATGLLTNANLRSFILIQLQVIQRM